MAVRTSAAVIPVARAGVPELSSIAGADGIVGVPDREPYAPSKLDVPAPIRVLTSSAVIPTASSGVPELSNIAASSTSAPTASAPINLPVAELYFRNLPFTSAVDLSTSSMSLILTAPPPPIPCWARFKLVMCLLRS